MISSRQIVGRRAFSLVELVIVILILGILAAVAAPRMFDQATTARQNGTRQSLVVIRNAIELYRAQNGALPTADIKTQLQPFLQGAFPRAEVGATTNHNDSVRVVNDANPLSPSGTEGWAYNRQTGQFIVNEATGANW